MAHRQLQFSSTSTVCMRMAYALVCVRAHARVCVIIHLNEPLRLPLRSKVNYIGHDVKGRFFWKVKTVPAPLSSYHGDSPANS